MFVLCLLFLCASAALAAPSEKQIFDLENELQLVELFNNFKIQYQKNYLHPFEHSARYHIFVKNLAKINAMNEQDPTATYGITEFADMSSEEHRETRTGLVLDPNFIPTSVVNASDVPDIKTPKEFDWRTQNAVTSVKNQGGCGSCWAFSSVGNIEGQYAIKHNQLVDFSPQELVSCDKNNGACAGGFMARAFQSLIEMGGIETEQDYPYQSGRGTVPACAFDRSKVKAVLTGFKALQLSTMSEDQVAQLLVSTGPLSIGIDADPVQHYQGGILKQCQSAAINHAVLLVGYGEENGEKYWLVKNSWGAERAEGGYFRMERGVNCLGILNDIAATAVVA